MAVAVKLLLTSIAGHADRRKAEVRDMVLEDHRPVGVDDVKIADAALRREKDHDAERAAGVVAVEQLREGQLLAVVAVVHVHGDALGLQSQQSL